MSENANINASVLQFLGWVSSEGKQAAKDEGQIVDTFATQLSEGVQAGETWTDAFNTAKAGFVSAELNEWQKLQLDAIEELAAVVDQANTILQGMANLIP